MFKDLLEKIKRKSQLEEYFNGSRKYRKKCKVVETEEKIYCYLKKGFIRKYPCGDEYIEFSVNRKMKNKPIINKPVVYVIKKLNRNFYRDLYIDGHINELIIKDSKLNLYGIDVLATEKIHNLTIENSIIKGSGYVDLDIKEEITIEKSTIFLEELLLKAKKINIIDSNLSLRDISFTKAMVKIKDTIIRARNIICRIKSIKFEDPLSMLNSTEKISLEIEEPSRVSISIPKEGEIICNGRKIEHTGGCISLQTSAKREKQENELKVAIEPKNITTFELEIKNLFGRVLKRKY